MKLGIDPVHFGIKMVVNMEVGMPPAGGLNLYVASGITKMGITAHRRGLALAPHDARAPGGRHLLAAAARSGCRSRSA